MSKKEKKELTTKQKKIRYRIAEYSTFAGEFVALITPFIVLGIINKDEWFINNTSGWKIGLGGTIAITITSIALLLVTKRKENKNITDGFVALVIGWFASALIFTFIQDIINQIANIMWFTGLGLLGAFGLNIVSKNFNKKANECSNLLKTANTTLDQEKALEEVKEEREKKKVKIKIKKGE